MHSSYVAKHFQVLYPTPSKYQADSPYLEPIESSCTKCPRTPTNSVIDLQVPLSAYSHRYITIHITLSFLANQLHSHHLHHQLNETNKTKRTNHPHSNIKNDYSKTTARIASGNVIIATRGARGIMKNVRIAI